MNSEDLTQDLHRPSEVNHNGLPNRFSGSSFSLFTSHEKNVSTCQVKLEGPWLALLKEEEMDKKYSFSQYINNSKQFEASRSNGDKGENVKMEEIGENFKC